MESAYHLTVSDIEAHADALLEFHAGFADFFRSATRSVAPQARDYLQGQLWCESRRNMSQMSAQVVERNHQALSNFVSTSPWEDGPLLETMGQQAAGLLSAPEEASASALILVKVASPSKARLRWEWAVSIVGRWAKSITARWASIWPIVATKKPP